MVFASIDAYLRLAHQLGRLGADASPHGDR
jgi:hypothetical protein